MEEIKEEEINMKSIENIENKRPPWTQYPYSYKNLREVDKMLLHYGFTRISTDEHYSEQKCVASRKYVSFTCNYCKKEIHTTILVKLKSGHTKHVCSDKPSIIPKGYKWCGTCKIIKNTNEYYKDSKNVDGYNYQCKSCCVDYNKTLDGFLCQLRNRSIYSSKTRTSKGRIEAGKHTITFEELKEQYMKQNGESYYCPIKMNYDKRDWRMSIERLNPDIGYTKENSVLCCLEFNGRIQWSREKMNKIPKILEYVKLQKESSIKPEYIVDFNKIIKTPRKSIKSEMIIIDGIEYWNCSYCLINKQRNEFNKFINQGCKECVSIRNKEYAKTPRGHISKLFRHAKSSTKTRTKIDNLRDNSLDITEEFLISMYYKQEGLCEYSGLPLTFGTYLENNWTCSLERKDPMKGYTQENTCLICLEFNTIDFTSVYKTDLEDTGNGSWSKEKFSYFLNLLQNDI
jgi:hypothetical protein